MHHAHLILPGSTVRLATYPTTAPDDVTRAEAEARFKLLSDELEELQALLFAASQHALLIILQGMDASGKDGTVRKVIGCFDPLGVEVRAFKVPSSLELSHDFLWRVHAVAPPRGMVGVFNRSHYEDILVARVRNLVPEEVWRQRYDHINAFERLLGDNQTLIVKIYLHISREEQEQRLREREHDVVKAWKLSAADWIERRYWDDYQAAYEDALGRCSTVEAPWYLVPADQKWFRNLAVAELLVETLRPHRETWLAALAALGRRELEAINQARRASRTWDLKG